MTDMSCKSIIDVFDKVGGVLKIDYKQQKCEFTPPPFARRLIRNGFDIYKEKEIIPMHYLYREKTECKLLKDKDTMDSIDMLLWSLSCTPNLDKMIEYHKCEPQKDGEFLRTQYHRYQEANTDGFTINMDITKM